MAKAKTSITTENRSGSAADAAAKEQRTEMPLSDLHPFEGHPFKVLDDELMEQTVESIKQIGVVSPLIVRPDPEGGYEILSGHRRLHAAQLAGLETVPVIVKEMDDDAAIIFMVDSNLQRENILPSERAFSYKMKLEAMKHQGERADLQPETTSRQLGEKLQTSVAVMSEEMGESQRQIQRFIRLTNLIPEILDMVDEKKIAFNPAVELSYLKPSEQKEFLEAMDYFLKCRLGKKGLAIKKYANGLDDSPVMRSDYVSPVKSIGHGITTMQDLENNAEVWCVMLELVQEIGTKLRTHKKKAGGIAISIRNNELFTKEWQCRISIPTQSPTYLAKTAFSLFAKNYQWEHPIRSVTVRAINLFEEDCPIQYDLFTDVKSLDRQERLDAAIEQIRFRFGKDAIKNGVLFQKSKMPTERKVDLVMPTGMIG